MNTKMLMFGILLLAGLSFAQPGSWNWMEYSTLKYYCNTLMLNDKINIAAEVGSDYFDSDIDEYRNDMWWALYDEGGPSLCYYSGCWGTDLASATSFRSKLLEYNTAVFQYNVLFTQGLRNAFSDPDYEGLSKEAVFGWLSQDKNGYLGCVTEYASNPCHGCPSS